MITRKSKCILCTILFFWILEIRASNERNFTIQWTSDYMYTPEIVNVNDHLLAFGLQNNTVIITSTFGKVESLICKLSLQPGEIASDKIRAIRMGNGKVIIHTSVLLEKKVAKFRLSDPVWDLFIILEPRDCSSLKTVEVHHGWDRDWVALVPYTNTFDLFYHMKAHNKTKTFQSPQRFNDQGDLVNLNYFLGLESQISGLKIQTISPYNASEGYISFLNSTIRYHDSQFKTIKKIDITNPIHSLSGIRGDVSYCYIKYPPKSNLTMNKKKFDFNNFENIKKLKKEHVVCELFDNQLRTKGLVELNNLENKRVYEVIVNNLPDGGALIATAHRGRRGPKGYPMEFYLQRIDPDGRAREPIQISEHSIFYHHMRLIPKQDKEFCLVDGGEMETFKAFTNLKNTIWINCIDVISSL